MTPEEANQGSFRAEFLESLGKPTMKHLFSEPARGRLIFDAKSGKLLITTE